MAETKRSFLDNFVSTIVIPLYTFFIYAKNNSWRISLKKANKLGFHQISDTTEANRYPEIFSYVSTITAEPTANLAFSKKSILSFGCSSGEECHTLRNYFSDAHITGYDIFEKNVIQAIKCNTDKNMDFYSKWEALQGTHFDIVFAMTVLCRSPHTYNKKDCSGIYTFAQFEKQIALLDTLLNENGLLVIYNANFLFTDTETAASYKPLKIPDYTDSGVVPKFSKSNKLLADQSYAFTVFRKLGSPHHPSRKLLPLQPPVWYTKPETL
jgi:hypothetical protein